MTGPIKYKYIWLYVNGCINVIAFVHEIKKNEIQCNKIYTYYKKKKNMRSTGLDGHLCTIAHRLSF